MLNCMQRLTTSVLILAAGSLAGCSGLDVPDLKMSEMTFFPNRGQLFKSQDWATAISSKGSPDFVSSRPVSPEDYIDGSGLCASQAVPPSTDVSVGAVSGDLGTTAAAPAAQTLAAGGVALGMTECQVVARAGQPGQVDIGADEAGGRKVVLTYMSGPWPGIYTFSAGRLKVVDRVAQPEPVKPAKKKARRPKTANSSR